MKLKHPVWDYPVWDYPVWDYLLSCNSNQKSIPLLLIIWSVLQVWCNWHEEEGIKWTELSWQPESVTLLTHNSPAWEISRRVVVTKNQSNSTTEVVFSVWGVIGGNLAWMTLLFNSKVKCCLNLIFSWGILLNWVKFKWKTYAWVNEPCSEDRTRSVYSKLS